MGELGEGDFFIYEKKIGKIMLCVCIYEIVTIGVSTISVEHEELNPVTTGSSGRSKYLERKIVTPSSKDVVIVMMLLVV